MSPMLSPIWSVRRSLDNSHHQTTILYTLNAPRNFNQSHEHTLKLHRSNPNHHNQNIIMIRGWTGKPVFRASPVDGPSTKPRKRPEDYLHPRLPPLWVVRQRGRFESQLAAPTVAGPQEEGYFERILAPSPPSTTPPSTIRSRITKLSHHQALRRRTRRRKDLLGGPGGLQRQEA
jgi:hypothetical protein